MPKAKRIFDVDWGQAALSMNRPAVAPSATSVNWFNYTDNETLLKDEQNGVAVYYQSVDLEQLTMEGRTFTPLAIDIQRPWTAPLGYDYNFNPMIRCYEILYIFTAPLANVEIGSGGTGALEMFKDLGLDSSIGGRGTTAYPGIQIPDAAQCIFAQSTLSLNSMANTFSTWNGTLVSAAPAADPPIVGDPFAPVMAGEMQVVEVNRWGSLPNILGPKLHCYRYISYQSQQMTGILGADNPILNAQGNTARNFSPISVKIICEEADLTESEYLVSAANAYNNANFDSENIS